MDSKSSRNFVQNFSRRSVVGWAQQQKIVDILKNNQLILNEPCFKSNGLMDKAAASYAGGLGSSLNKSIGLFRAE